MRRLVLISILVLLALPIFSQDMPPDGDDYARFRGVWCAETEDGNNYFIFENNTAIILGYDGGESLVEFDNFMLSYNKIIFHHKYIFYLDDSGWQYVGPDDLNDEYRTDEGNYVFSGDKLILIFDGNPWKLSKMN
jgi:hypothetical protein